MHMRALLLLTCGLFCQLLASEIRAAVPQVMWESSEWQSMYVGDERQVKVQAIDYDGYVARVVFYAGSEAFATLYQAPWEATYRPLVAGTYNIKAVAYDNRNGAGYSPERSITVLQNIAPTVSLTSPANAANYINGQSIPLSATASDSDGSVLQVEFLDGTTVLHSDVSAPYEYNWSGAAIGSHQISARALDNRNNSTTSNVASITVAQARPTISMSSPTANALYQLYGAPVSFNATASDSDGYVTKVEFFNNGSPIGAPDTQAPYTLTWSPSGPGEHTVFARATDNLGGTAETTPIKIYANAPPTVSVSSPAANAVFTFGTGVPITVSPADSDGFITKVEYLRGTTVLHTQTQSPWTWTWSGAQAGVQNISARATDNRGGVQTSQSVPIRINLPPTVSITAPSSSTNVVAVGDSLTFTASAGDSDGTLRKVEFYAGTEKLAEILNYPYSFTYSPVPPGTRSITARAYDNDFATTSSAAVSVIGNYRPTVSLVDPANGSRVTRGSTVTLTASASDSDGSIKEVRFYQGSTHLGTDTTSPYTATWAASSVGSYPFTATAVDDRNMSQTSATSTLHADYPPPSVTVTAPAVDSVHLYGNFVTLSADVSAVEGSIENVVFHIDGTPVGSRTSPPYSMSWAPPASGTYALTVKATITGNVSQTSAPRSFKVNRPPSIGFTQPAQASTVVAAGGAITLATNPTDPDGTIKRVELKRNGVLWQTLTASPYTYTWSNPPAGTYAFEARVVDNLDFTADTGAISVRVNAPPTIAIAAPAQGATITAGSTVELRADAIDSDGTVSVEFQRDGISLGNDGTAPFTAVADGLPIGTSRFRAIARDNDSAVTSTEITVTGNGKPGVTLALGSAGPYAEGNPISLRATTTDPENAVAKVRFFDGDTQIGEATSAAEPNVYVLSWTPIGVRTHTLTAHVYDQPGANSASPALAVAVVAAPPVVKLTSPVAGRVYHDNEPIIMSADTTGSRDQVEAVNFYVNRTDAGTDFRNPELAETHFSLPWTQALPGEHSIFAVAITNGASQGTPEVKFRVNRRPVVQVAAPAQSAVFYGNVDLPLTVHAYDTDGGRVTSVRLLEFFNGTKPLPGDAVPTGGDLYEYLWKDAPYGRLSYFAEATDNDGGTRGTSNALREIYKIPTVEGAVTGRISMSQPCTLPSDDLNTPYQCSVKVEYEAIGATNMSCLWRNGAPSACGVGKSTAWLPATALPQKIELRATNVNPWTLRGARSTFHLLREASPLLDTAVLVADPGDNAGPTVVWTEPVDGQALVANEPLTVKLHLTDSDGVQFVDVWPEHPDFFGGTGVSKPEPVSNTRPTEYVVTLNFVTMPEGTYRLRAQAFDVKGGATESFITVNVGTEPAVNTPPSLSVTSPAGGSKTVQPGADLVVSGNVSDPGGFVAHVDIEEILGDENGTRRLLERIERPADSFSRTFTDIREGMSLAITAVDNTGLSSPTVYRQIITSGAQLTSVTPTNYSENHADRIKSAEVVGALGDDMFGEQVNFYTGSTEFRHTDLAIPGNSGLPVSVQRRFVMRHAKQDPFGNAFGDWELDVPYLSGTFAADAGWKVAAAPQLNRCSAPTSLLNAMPPASTANRGHHAYEIWNGTSMSIPGAGEQSVLFNETPKVVNGVTYRWITRDNWLIGCLTSLKNAKPGTYAEGEGFVALSPDGTRYEFAWMATRPAKSLQSTDVRPGGTVRYYLQRKEFRLYVTRIDDRFGNSVAYEWSGDSLARPRLDRISANDGRAIAFTYEGKGSRIVEVSAGPLRKVEYTYSLPDAGAGSLKRVEYADGSAWTLDIPNADEGSGRNDYDRDGSLECAVRRYLNDKTYSARITHPAGASGTFEFGFKRHHRSGVPSRFCYVASAPLPAPGTPVMGTGGDNDIKDDVSLIPIAFDVLALTKKSISGDATSLWNYEYNDNRSALHASSESLPDHRYVSVVQPDGAVLRMTFGRRYHDEGQSAATAPDGRLIEKAPRREGNEGQLLASELFEAGVIFNTDGTTSAPPRRASTTDYVGWSAADLQAEPHTTTSILGFKDRVGRNPNLMLDNFQTEYRRPVKREMTRQDGIEYVREVKGFNEYAVPTAVHRYSQTPAAGTQPASVLHSVVDSVEHQHDTASWVLNLERRKTVRRSPAEPEYQVERTKFNAESLPQEVYGPADTLASRFAYSDDGSVERVTDALGRETILLDYRRGIPRLISFPAAEPGLARTTMSAIVDDMGRITQAKSQLNIATDYRYDAMGRLNRVLHPEGDDVAWADRVVAFAELSQSEFGIKPGMWKQSFAEGNYRKDVYFDGRWRPMLTREYDAVAEAAAVAAGNANPTQRITVKRYDDLGRLEFESYPVSTAESPYAVTQGTTYSYDVLGRLESSTQTSELGHLTTRVAYSNGKKTVTDPRNVSTEYEFRAFDQPDESAPSKIVQAAGLPEAITTTIERNVFGNTTSITRSGSFATPPTTATRSYVYDADQRLCKRIQPETGTTLFHYDAVGNLDWSAEGLNLPSLTCETETSNIQKTTRIYDGLNRLKQVDYPGAPAVDYTYYADGALDTIESTPDGVVWDYEYNLRRLLKQEAATFEGQTRTFVHTYDTQGSALSITYPGGLVVDYAPNGLGQPTKAGSFATGVQYHPNGAVKQFEYGNGVKRCNTLNARQLVGRTQDGAADANCVFATSIHDFGYEFDANGNVGVITDNVADTATRTMHYDALNRLTKANGRWDGAKGDATDADYSYDPLDNLRTANIRGRKYVYSYDETTHRLSSIANNGTGEGFDFGYDLRGNQTRKSTTSYTFDSANRLTGIPGLRNLYSYDGHGRRVLQDRDGKREYSFYTQDGLQRGGLDAKDPASKKTEWQIYLGKSLLATWSKAGEYPDAAGAGAAVTYHHTDALGSPVLETDASGAVVRRIRYAPYGESLDGVIDGPGYTGHVMDGDSGLTYMQQRYYDPNTGRFLSVDPVTVESGGNINHFTRYAYGYNNPYTYNDPDGQLAVLAAPIVVPVLIAGAAGGAIFLATRTPEEKQAIADSIDGYIGGMFTESEEAAGAKPGTPESDEGCVYCIPGEYTESGKDYVGTADDLKKRAETATDGRDRENAEVVGSYKKGDRTGRQEAEQREMNNRGGKKNLDNKRNEIRESKWKSRGVDPPKEGN